MDIKRFYTSKTFWFFLLFLTVSVANVVGFGGYEPSAEQLEIGSVLVAVAGIILRFITKEPISLRAR